MSRPADFETLLADWLADDGPSDVPPRVAQGAIAQVRSLTPADTGPSTPVRSVARPMRLLALAATLVLLGATVAVAASLLRPSLVPLPAVVDGLPANGLIIASEDGDVILVDPSTGAKEVLRDDLGDDAVTTVSPDGRTIAWWSQDEIDRTWSLLIRDISPGADGSTSGFSVEQPGTVAWAPGSNLIAVIHAVRAKGRLTIIDRQGGLFEDFPDLDAYGATWRPDGKALAVQVRGGDGAELVEVPYTGGDPVVLARGGPVAVPEAAMFELWSPAWSPDGEHIASLSQASGATRADGTPAVRVVVMNRDGSESRLLEVPGDDTSQTFVRWSADGRSLLIRLKGADATTFVRQPIDGTPGREVARLEGATGWRVAWSPDETKLVAARQHEPARIIDLASGDATLQSWMTAYDLAWQPIPHAPAE